ncbi:MAG TPA: PilZ domain-containing protein [Vicinamibacterales bacterium]
MAAAGRENLLSSVPPAPCTVLIAAPDLLPTLERRAAPGDGELITFTDADALRALAEITRRRPRVVAIDRRFAATPRGAALINRIKADPALADCEIRIVSHDTVAAEPEPLEDFSEPDVEPEPAIEAPRVEKAPVIEFRGTRRAPRFRIAGTLDAMVDGTQASLVDLSVIGAQVVSPIVLKPNQRVRMALQDQEGAVRFNASVAWASFEIPPNSGPRYRAGLEFIDADATAIDAYCLRHKA